MEPTIEQALQRALEAHKEGKLHDAEHLYDTVLESQPKHIIANYNLGLIAVSLNKVEAALPLFKIALEANPKIEKFWLSYIDALIKEKEFENAKRVLEKAKNHGMIGEKLNILERELASVNEIKNVSHLSPSQEQIDTILDHYQNGRLNEAENLAISITNEFPMHNFGWKVLGAVLKQTGRINESLIFMDKSVQLAPQDPEVHNNLGVSLQELGRLEEAEASYTQAIILKPDYAEAHSNLGSIFQELGRLEEAVASYTQAIALNPKLAEVHNNLGIIFQKMDRFEEAEESYRDAIELKPQLAEAHNNLGSILQDLDRLEEAEASFMKAIALKPDYSEPYLNLCELLEKSNRIDEVLLVIKNASTKVFDHKYDFLYYEALIQFRNENYEAAGELISKINEDELALERRGNFMNLKADCYHYKKNYKAAFEAFEAVNEYQKNSLKYSKQGSENFLNYQRKKIIQLEQLQDKSPYKNIIKSSWYQPTFLIGFPRSGTTLLDTILRTHSKIDVLEELPMLEKMIDELGLLTKISMVEEIDNPGAAIASSFYFKELNKYIELDKNRVVIDKYPLNILQLPLINQIFPEAKYILALRHPLDCVLSCWMQYFGLNIAMSNMLDLNRIVDFYCIAMEVLTLSEKRYSLNIHKIRYEDLVLDFEEEVSNILGFLNLKWEQELKNYQKTALIRRIRTPSYSQVIKPIYKTSSYRWKNYEKYLNPYKGQLEPWLSAYDYLD